MPFNLLNRLGKFWKLAKSYFQSPPIVENCQHDWQEEYYGTRCKKCNQFHAHGPWMPEEDYTEDDDSFCDYCGHDKYDFSDGGCHICCPHLHEEEEDELEYAICCEEYPYCDCGLPF